MHTMMACPDEGRSQTTSRLGRKFYSRDTLTVARDLLGQRLVRVLDGQRLAGRILEVEAYIGEKDTACHAAAGRTSRTEVMYGPPGHVYVYFIYGMYHCLNVVTEQEGFPAAVLVRSIKPVEGLEIMRSNRRGRSDAELANGPGKLCQALCIDLQLNQVDLCTSDELYLEEEPQMAEEDVVRTPRVGVRGDHVAMAVPWRFCLVSPIRR
jgi:DNA-3-methyladenine glycosylase